MQACTTPKDLQKEVQNYGLRHNLLMKSMGHRQYAEVHVFYEKAILTFLNFQFSNVYDLDVDKMSSEKTILDITTGNMNIDMLDFWIANNQLKIM
ncbi:hypothetical protein Glove_230g102 [Diversispora epigaea]|uniref:Uncharacterized protein n=1 Tax=Diversispora epigaea TaxID=1348612 RepID=A0A397ILH7_9GLOM|nr:hypothetical protein Glove_230g102 [Diversispora epigaea]